MAQAFFFFEAATGGAKTSTGTPTARADAPAAWAGTALALAAFGTFACGDDCAAVDLGVGTLTWTATGRCWSPGR